MNWKIVYKQAIQKDGSVLFPERFSLESLNEIKRKVGSYIFANQYQNIVIPDDEKRFRPEWIKHADALPYGEKFYTFGFIDPAIGQKDNHDFTGVSIVSVDTNKNWYCRLLRRYKITPTQIVDLCFKLHKEFDLLALGIETIAYQEALLYMLDTEMRLRNEYLPVKGINQKGISKNVRILGLVPLFEFGRIFIPSHCKDFKDEYDLFPRAQHDDILDSLASLVELIYYPEKERIFHEPRPTDKDYESHIIRKLGQQARYGESID